MIRLFHLCWWQLKRLWKRSVLERACVRACQRVCGRTLTCVSVSVWCVCVSLHLWEFPSPCFSLPCRSCPAEPIRAPRLCVSYCQWHRRSSAGSPVHISPTQRSHFLVVMGHVRANMKSKSCFLFFFNCCLLISLKDTETSGKSCCQHDIKEE